ncbi:hypothetical protein ONZ43_g596 [Nemania bipapillata]|uniref:Uncharacterized protein n=1 Tax=Nemania bipapillata TaxID=110536 RepID=A0ACC2J7P6_9PEZI|nr:hypothetical protein ONZ43_g596 [Nemania bipapillata]
MQPGNLLDEDPSLAELGYDIIGTDGESQAESIASSFDYQKSDDIQSLVGTDVDTDSSDDEETTLNDTITSDTTIVGEVHQDDAAADTDAETLDMMNRSLESPTSLSLSNFSPFTSMSYLDHVRTYEPNAVIRHQSPTVEDLSLVGRDKLTTELSPADELEHPEPDSPKTTQGQGVFQLALGYLQEKRRALALSGLVLLVYIFSVFAKPLLFSPLAPRELSTVPVASVPLVVPSSSVGITHSPDTPTLTISPSSNALQTTSSPNGLLSIPFGKDNTHIDVAAALSATVCSAELSGRDEIIIRIPQNVKSSWLAKDAILIAVSRGLQDIPTKVSSVDAGFLIQIPLKEAHGVLGVTIATTHKPRINEFFPINFGTYRFTEALDAGRQLVRGFAQIVVDTVNETTSWVEETYIPALDVVSKQVCGQTASVSGSVMHGLQEVTEIVLAIPSRLVEQIQQSLDVKSLVRRISQLQLELAQETENIRDELRMAVLMSQINSRLLWLKLQGKVEEHGQYLSKVEVYLKEQRARVESARAERAELIKKQRRAWRERDRPVTKSSFWSTLGAWAGLEE